MSLLGIDVGSSSVKIGAYRHDGELIAVERMDLDPQHPRPGWWEQDPVQVWQATSTLLHTLMQNDLLRGDPPRALAVCASVRENFPADENGDPLGDCIMAADVRGSEFEALPEGVTQPEAWAFSCGHLRERMDPINRLLWWHENRPAVMQQAAHFPGWHEYLALKLCGRSAADPAVASRWKVFDLETESWALDRVAEHGLKADLLPEILPWGTIIGEVKKDLLEAWGIPAPVFLAVGSSDLNGAALGAGVTSAGEICLASGSFENLLIATPDLPTRTMLVRGLSVTPHPGSAGRAIWAICPTGTAVLNWARTLMNVSIEDLDAQLGAAPATPSSELAIPYLSGAFMYWEGGRKLRGSLLDLTLASQPIDLIRSLMESIAYDHVHTLSLLRDEGIASETVRAMGGGTRSTWWTQLKADMMGIPIEVVQQPEPGTLGGALLAGYALGEIDDLASTSRSYAGVSRRHEPDPARSALHQEKRARYHDAVQQMLTLE